LTLAECKKYVDATLNINVYKVLWLNLFSTKVQIHKCTIKSHQYFWLFRFFFSKNNRYVHLFVKSIIIIIFTIF
jgi:hypothetical protein